MWASFFTGAATKATSLIEERDKEIQDDVTLKMNEAFKAAQDTRKKGETRRDKLREYSSQLMALGFNKDETIAILNAGESNAETVISLAQEKAKISPITEKERRGLLPGGVKEVPGTIQDFITRRTTPVAPEGATLFPKEQMRGAFGLPTRAAETTTKSLLARTGMTEQELLGRLPEEELSTAPLDFSALAAERTTKAPTTEQLKATLGDLVAQSEGGTYQDRLVNALGTEQGAILWKRLQDRGATSELISPKAKSDTVSAKEQQIADLMEIGLPRSEAIKLAYGLIQVFADAELANVVIVDKTTGTQREVPFGEASTAMQALAIGSAAASQQQSRFDIPKDAEIEIKNITKGKTLWEASELGTGAWSAARSALSRISGQFGGPEATQTEGARAALRIYARDLARAIVENPRMPVALFQSALDDAATVPGTFDTPKLMQERLRTLDRFLRNRLEQAERDAEDKTLPRSTRANQASNAATLRNFIPQLGIPREGRSSKEKPPTGVTQREWDAMSEEDKKLFR